MQVLFHGMQSTEEAAESLLGILKLFKDRYGIGNYREMNLNITLLDTEGHDVELVDAATSEILSIFEVYKSGEFRQAKNDEKPILRLVVDNTKPKE